MRGTRNSWRAAQPVTNMRPKRIKPEQRLAFRLTPRERDLIIERTFVDAELEDRLRAAQALGSRLVVHLTLDVWTILPAMSQPKRIIVKSHGCGERSKLCTTDLHI